MGHFQTVRKVRCAWGVIPWSYNAESFEYFHLNDRQSDDPQTTRGGCLFNYCQPLMCNDTELHRSPSIGPRLPTGMHSMQLPCCMQCTIHITWLDTAWQVCKGSAVLLLVLALHINTYNGTQAIQNESSLYRARQPQDLHILLTVSLRCSALISAVEDTCGLPMISNSQWGVSQLVVACLPLRSKQPGLQVICCSASYRCFEVSKISPLHWVVTKMWCRLHAIAYTKAARGELYITLGLWTLLPAQIIPLFPPETRAVSLKEKGPTT